MSWLIRPSVRRGVASGLAAAGVLAVLGVMAWSAAELMRFERLDAQRTTVVYAAGQSLVPGLRIGALGLPATLARLGYTEVRQGPSSPGQFRRSPTDWEIFLRGDEGTRASPTRVRLDLRDGRIDQVTRDGHETEAVSLEPEVLTNAASRPHELHHPVRLAEVPPRLINAFLAAEDRRFYGHGGVDVTAVARAAWANVRAGRVAQGGSTITQQLVKMRLLRPDRTLARKLREAWLAELVEWRYSKEQILEAYLNEIYLGERGTFSLHGVGAAAEAYFAKDVRGLTLGEAALIAGLARAPNTYSPATNPARARRRRDEVLGRMRALGSITAEEERRARREPVHVRPLGSTGPRAPYFVDHVRQEFEQRVGADVASLRGARIYTTLDPVLQRQAETAVARGLDRLETDHPRLRRGRHGHRRLQAALVALDPATGAIRALVGGRDYATSQFDRATHARRQPGSAFKPFVYLAAIRNRGQRPVLTPASLVDDDPVVLTVGTQEWRPRNYQDRYEGPVTVRKALELSLNAATVRIAQRVGLPAVVDTARAMGIADTLAPVPALALGAFELTPLELARAYAAFASGGRRPPRPWAIRAVTDDDGEVGRAAPDEAAQVISPAEAYVMTSLLQGVITSGTGNGARAFDLPAGVAGKTGTTNDGRDAWFVGYAPHLLALVWVGSDNGSVTGLTGAEAALPIWADFMAQALDTLPPAQFAVPPGIVFASIDPTTGKVAGPFCPVAVREAFLAGTVPGPCDAHRLFAEDVRRAVAERITGWWDHVTRWFRP